jgi:hypothetical protein
VPMEMAHLACFLVLCVGIVSMLLLHTPALINVLVGVRSPEGDANVSPPFPFCCDCVVLFQYLFEM